MTQLAGESSASRTRRRRRSLELNESYVYCLRTTAGEIAAQVKKALEKEGYEGEAASLVKDESEGPAPARSCRNIRPQFKKLYTRPFEGKIYLPRFCVKQDERCRGQVSAARLFRAPGARVDVEQFDYSPRERLAAARGDESGQGSALPLSAWHGLESEYETEIDLCESDGRVKAWLASNLEIQFPQPEATANDRRPSVRPALVHEAIVERPLGDRQIRRPRQIAKFIEDQLDLQTEKAFERLFDAGRVQFYLECEHCRFEVPPSIRLDFRGRFTPLMHDDGQQVQKSLFDQVENESHNEYERAVALVLDRDEQVLWWYRNRVGPENFTIQGPRRHRIFPDFVVQGNIRAKLSTAFGSWKARASIWKAIRTRNINAMSPRTSTVRASK